MLRFVFVSIKLLGDRLLHFQHDSSCREKFKTGFGECQVFLGNQKENYFKIHVHGASAEKD
jgi:hypothetical protein